MKVPAIVACIGIVTLGILEGLALWKGVDGIYFASVVAVIAAICGVAVRDVIQIVRQQK